MTKCRRKPSTTGVSRCSTRGVLAKIASKPLRAVTQIQHAERTNPMTEMTARPFAWPWTLKLGRAPSVYEPPKPSDKMAKAGGDTGDFEGAKRGHVPAQRGDTVAAKSVGRDTSSVCRILLIEDDTPVRERL